MTQQTSPFGQPSPVPGPAPTYGPVPGPYVPQTMPPMPPMPPGFGPGAPAPVPPRRRTGRIVAGVVGGVAALGLAGGALLLFGEATLDTAEVAERIAAETEQQAGMRATDVECPDDVPAAAGDTFTCSAQLDGQPVTYTVRQDDDEGNVRFELDDEIVLMDQVERLLAEQVTADYEVAVTAACDADGRRVLVDGTQTPLPCTVTNVDDPADSIAVVASVQPDGSVDYAEA
jgi:uncharacterized protein DUF4333